MFLAVDGGSGSGTSSVYGTPFPTRTADQDNSYLREATISIVKFRGCHRNAPLHARNLAKTIARDKPVSTLNVLANIKKTNIGFDRLIKHI